MKWPILYSIYMFFICSISALIERRIELPDSKGVQQDVI